MKKDELAIRFPEYKGYGLPRKRDTVKKILFEKIFPFVDWKCVTDEMISSWIGVSGSYVGRCRRKYEAQLGETKR